jgi:hypothetical protein
MHSVRRAKQLHDHALRARVGLAGWVITPCGGEASLTGVIMQLVRWAKGGQAGMRTPLLVLSS